MRLPLILHPRPSPSLAAALLTGHGAAVAVLIPLAVPLWVKFAAALGLLLSAFAAIRRLRGNLPAALALGADGAVRLDWQGGASVETRAAADTVVLPWLVVMALDGGGRRYLPLAADSLSAGEFRDLRLWLRWRSRTNSPADS